MARCLKPLKGWRDTRGKIHLDAKPSSYGTDVPIPCGQCLHCRLERARQWAVRILHEAQLHDTNYFGTFTYAEEKRPRELVHWHFQKFLKRARKRWGPFRYFMCGEYGDRSGHAHYHACLFGLYLDDLKLHSRNNGHTLYTSEKLDTTWSHGHCTVGQITMESAQYVAAYCTKKIQGAEAREHYTRFDPDTGEVWEQQPEYAQMSRRPGIAARWIAKYTDDVYNYDHVVINGREQKPPRYYDKYLERTNPERKWNLKAPRQRKAKQWKGGNNEQSLKAAEANTRARLKLKTRTI